MQHNACIENFQSLYHFCMEKPDAESSYSCFTTRKQRDYLHLFIVGKAEKLFCSLWDLRPFKTCFSREFSCGQSKSTTLYKRRCHILVTSKQKLKKPLYLAVCYRFTVINRNTPGKLRFRFKRFKNLLFLCACVFEPETAVRSCRRHSVFKLKFHGLVYSVYLNKNFGCKSFFCFCLL